MYDILQHERTTICVFFLISGCDPHVIHVTLNSSKCNAQFRKTFGIQFTNNKELRTSTHIQQSVYIEATLDIGFIP